jgi:hypothetical protein
MTLAPPTIDRRALVRLRLLHGKCPSCGGPQTGRRVCCQRCTAEGRRYCPAREHIVAATDFGAKSCYCRACDAAKKAETRHANIAASRAAQAATYARRMAQQGRTVTPDATIRAAQRAERAAWAVEVVALRAQGWTWVQIGAWDGTSASAVQNRLAKHRRWAQQEGGL